MNTSRQYNTACSYSLNKYRYFVLVAYAIDLLDDIIPEIFLI